MTMTARVYHAIQGGCETIADIEAELDFATTRHRIAALVAQLKRQGRIVKIGVALTPTEHRYPDGIVRGGAVRTFRWAVKGAGGEATERSEP